MITIWMVGWMITAAVFLLMALDLTCMSLYLEDARIPRAALLCWAGVFGSVAWPLMIVGAFIFLINKLINLAN